MYWLDSAKGFGVILIIAGHLLYISDLKWLNKLIYAFHVPMFFLFAGYTCHISKEHFLYKKVKRLLIPFVSYALVGFPYFAALHYKEAFNNNTMGGIFTLICNTLYFKGTLYNAPLWFLIVLFELFAISFLLNISKTKHFLWVILSCIASCALSFFIYLCNISCFKFFGFDRAILMFTFFSAGIIISRIKLDKINKVCILLTGFFSLIILVVFGVILNTKVSVYSYQLGRYPFFLLSSFGGSLASIVLCYVFFNKKCFLSELSKYGILFLGTQYFLIGPFRYVINDKM